VEWTVETAKLWIPVVLILLGQLAVLCQNTVQSRSLERRLDAQDQLNAELFRLLAAHGERIKGVEATCAATHGSHGHVREVCS